MQDLFQNGKILQISRGSGVKSGAEGQITEGASKIYKR